MFISTPKSWVRCSQAEFVLLLGFTNWKKDDFGFYCHVSNGHRFAIEGQDGIWIDPGLVPKEHL